MSHAVTNSPVCFCCIKKTYLSSTDFLDKVIK